MSDGVNIPAGLFATDAHYTHTHVIYYFYIKRNLLLSKKKRFFTIKVYILLLLANFFYYNDGSFHCVKFVVKHIYYRVVEK